MRPLGPNQRRLLEALADGKPLAGGAWSNHKFQVTVQSLMDRGLVEEVEAHVQRGTVRRVTFHYQLTEQGLATFRSALRLAVNPGGPRGPALDGRHPAKPQVTGVSKKAG